MKVILTAGECLDRGIWMEMCELKGINEWAIAQVVMNRDEEIVFNKEEAEQLRLIK